MNRFFSFLILVASDVDGDQDKDLVFIDWDSLLPLVIWLNDGKGNFEIVGHLSHLLLLADEGPSSVQDTDLKSQAVLSGNKEERFPFTKNGTRTSTILFCSTWMKCREIGLHVKKASPPSLLLRSPPLILAFN